MNNSNEPQQATAKATEAPDVLLVEGSENAIIHDDPVVEAINDATASLLAAEPDADDTDCPITEEVVSDLESDAESDEEEAVVIVSSPVSEKKGKKKKDKKKKHGKNKDKKHKKDKKKHDKKKDKKHKKHDKKKNKNKKKDKKKH